MSPIFLTALSCTAALGVFTTAVLIAQLRGSQLRPGIPLFAGSILLGALFLLVAPLSVAELTPHAVVRTWIPISGCETAKAAVLTTDRFRRGQSCPSWAEQTPRLLQQIGYQRLGGRVLKKD